MRRAWMAFLLAGCGPAVVPIGGGGSSSGGEPPPTTSGATTDTSSDGSTSWVDSGSSSSDDSSSGSTGGGFIEDPETACGVLPDGVFAHCAWCSPMAQDCGQGDACRAWANDGGDAWNATRCAPVSDDAGQRGDPCTVEGSGSSGIDTCDAGLMCWNVEPNTLEGACAEYCDPGYICDDPAETCAVSNDGALPLCLPTCDPLASECGEGVGCYALDDQFVCLREGEQVYVGGAFVAECPAGSVGVAPESIETCTNDAPCCAAWCDVSAPNCDPGLECFLYLGEAFPGFEDVGVCVSP